MATINYAGVPLLIPGEDVLSWLGANYDFSRMFATPVDWSPKNTDTPPPSPRINQLYWPTGASRFGHFVGLANTDSLTEIMEAVPDARSLSNFNELVLKSTVKYGETQRTHKLTIPMHLLEPRTVSFDPGDLLDFGEWTRGSLWLLPFVDQRYFWRLNHTGELAITDSSAWEDLFYAIETQLGITITRTAPVTAWGIPDAAQCTKQHADIPHLLDAAAYSTGQRLMVRLDGSVELLPYGLSTELLMGSGSNLSIIYDHYSHIVAGREFAKFGFYRSAPEYVIVSFPKMCYGVPLIDGDRYAYSVSYEDAADAALGDWPFHESAVVQGAYKRFWSTAYADFSSGGGTPDNDSFLSDLADAIATAYYGSIYRRYYLVVAGLMDWPICSYDDFILWTIGPEDITTTIRSLPHNWDIELLIQQDPDLILYSDTMLKGVSAETIALNGYGNMSVYQGGADTGDDLRVYHDWITNSDIISTGKKMLARFFFDQCHWSAIDRECEAS